MSRQGGFTLTELLATAAIALVLGAVAVPSFRGVLDGIALRGATDELFSAVQFTRAQAIARNARVLLAPAGEGGDWAKGWAVFVDADGDRRPGEGDEILLLRGPLARGISASASFSSQQSPPYLAYNGGGRACAATNSMVARFGSLTLQQGEAVRRIKISMLGRARVCNPAHDRTCGGDSGVP
ncbi:MAG TPA: GspH/FimT family pseudopilin [Telluria sp.]|nr:GspH/FimT family pseudopilin [Telluria sp.]